MLGQVIAAGKEKRTADVIMDNGNIIIKRAMCMNNMCYTTRKQYHCGYHSGEHAQRKVTGPYRNCYRQHHRCRFRPGHTLQGGGCRLCQLTVLAATITMIPANTTIGILAITSLSPVTRPNSGRPAAMVEILLRDLSCLKIFMATAGTFTITGKVETLCRLRLRCTDEILRA